MPINIHVLLVVGKGKSPRVLAAQLNDRFIERELAREVVDTPRGAKRTVKRARTFERVLSLANTTGYDSTLKANFAVVSAEIRNKLEQLTTRTFKESETIEQIVEIDGSALAKVAVVWVERRQLGVANVSVNGTTVSVPFELAQNLELRLLPISK